jgi:hypothetical protein
MHDLPPARKVRGRGPSAPMRRGFLVDGRPKLCGSQQQVPAPARRRPHGQPLHEQRDRDDDREAARVSQQRPSKLRRPDPTADAWTRRQHGRRDKAERHASQCVARVAKHSDSAEYLLEPRAKKHEDGPGGEREDLHVIRSERGRCTGKPGSMGSTSTSASPKPGSATP